MRIDALAATALLTKPMLCLCYVNHFAPIVMRFCIALAATALLTNPTLCLCYVNHCAPLPMINTDED